MTRRYLWFESRPPGFQSKSGTVAHYVAKADLRAYVICLLPPPKQLGLDAGATMPSFGTTPLHPHEL